MYHVCVCVCVCVCLCVCWFAFQSLIISSAARRTCTVGEIVNLVSADTQKLMDFVVYFNAVWLAPIEITLCLFFLWQVLAALVSAQLFVLYVTYTITASPKCIKIHCFM